MTEATLGLALSSAPVAEGDHSGILDGSSSDTFAAFAEHWDSPRPSGAARGGTTRFSCAAPPVA